MHAAALGTVTFHPSPQIQMDSSLESDIYLSHLLIKHMDSKGPNERDAPTPPPERCMIASILVPMVVVIILSFVIYFTAQRIRSIQRSNHMRDVYQVPSDHVAVPPPTGSSLRSRAPIQAWILHRRFFFVCLRDAHRPSIYNKQTIQRAMGDSDIECLSEVDIKLVKNKARLRDIHRDLPDHVWGWFKNSHPHSDMMTSHFDGEEMQRSDLAVFECGCPKQKSELSRKQEEAIRRLHLKYSSTRDGAFTRNSHKKKKPVTLPVLDTMGDNDIECLSGAEIQSRPRCRVLPEHVWAWFKTNNNLGMTSHFEGEEIRWSDLAVFQCGCPKQKCELTPKQEDVIRRLYMRYNSTRDGAFTRNSHKKGPTAK